MFKLSAEKGRSREPTSFFALAVRCEGGWGKVGFERERGERSLVLSWSEKKKYN